MTTTATRTNIRTRSSRPSKSRKPIQPAPTEAEVARKKERQDGAKALALLGFDAIEQAATACSGGDLGDTLNKIWKKTLSLKYKLQYDNPIEEDELPTPIPAGSLTLRRIEEVRENLGEEELKNLRKCPELVGAYDLLDRWLDA